MRALEIEDALTSPARRSTAAAPSRRPTPGSRLAPRAAVGRCRASSASRWSLLLVLWAPWRRHRAHTAQAARQHRRRRVAAVRPWRLGDSVARRHDARVCRAAGEPARLFVRKLDQLQAAALAGTEGAASPFFSPDGQWIAFFAGGKLKKVSVDRRRRRSSCATRRRPRRHVDRRRHDHLLADEQPDATLMRVPAAGGTPTASARSCRER